MSTRFSLAATLLLLGAILPTLEASAAAPVSPAVVAIQPKDLPKGFTLVQHTFLGARELSSLERVSERAFQKHGFVNAYVIQFSRGGSIGVGALTSEVVSYRTTTGAQWDYAKGIKRDAKILKGMKAPGVGTRSAGFTRIRRGLVTYQIDFQRGAFDAQVGVVGRSGGVSMADAVRYAQIMASRMG